MTFLEESNRHHQLYLKDMEDVERGGSFVDRFTYISTGTNVRHEEEVEKSASIGMLLLLSMPRMPIQMAWAAQWAALGPYLSTMIPPYVVQLTQVIGPVTGIIVAPTIGVLSDRSTHPWGRRRPFLLYAAFASAICWTLMGLTPQIGNYLGDEGYDAKNDETNRFYTALLMIFFYTWMDVTVNIVQTPAFLIIADFAGERQTTGAALGQSWAAFGSIIVALYIQIFGAAHKTMHYFMGMLSFTMVSVITMVCFVAREIPLDASELALDQESSLTRIRQAFQAIGQGLTTLPKPLAIYGIVLFFGLYGLSAYNGNKGQFFGIVVYEGVPEDADNCDKYPFPTCSYEQNQYNKGVRAASGTIDLIYNIVGYIYLLILPALARCLGLKKIMSLCIVPQIFFMYMALSKDVLIGGIICVAAFVTGATLIALLVPVVYEVMGPSSDIGIYIGVLNSALCFAQLANFLVGALVSGILQEDKETTYIIIMFIGGAVSLIGFFASFFVKVDGTSS